MQQSSLAPASTAGLPLALSATEVLFAHSQRWIRVVRRVAATVSLSPSSFVSGTDMDTQKAGTDVFGTLPSLPSSDSDSANQWPSYATTISNTPSVDSAPASDPVAARMQSSAHAAWLSQWSQCLAAEFSLQNETRRRDAEERREQALALKQKQQQQEQAQQQQHQLSLPEKAQLPLQQSSLEQHISSDMRQALQPEPHSVDDTTTDPERASKRRRLADSAALVTSSNATAMPSSQSTSQIDSKAPNSIQPVRDLASDSMSSSSSSSAKSAPLPPSSTSTALSAPRKRPDLPLGSAIFWSQRLYPGATSQTMLRTPLFRPMYVRQFEIFPNGY
jgi:hypothetical protein